MLLNYRERRVCMMETFGDIKALFFAAGTSSFQPLLTLEKKSKKKRVDPRSTPGAHNSQLVCVLPEKGLCFVPENPTVKNSSFYKILFLYLYRNISTRTSECHSASLRSAPFKVKYGRTVQKSQAFVYLSMFANR